MEPLTSIDVYRSIVAVIACLAMAINLSLAATLAIRRPQIRLKVNVWIAYATVAGLTNGISLYFRLHDGLANLPMQVGDFTAVIPTCGFLAAGIMGWRAYGRETGHAEVARKHSLAEARAKSLTVKQLQSVA